MNLTVRAPYTKTPQGPDDPGNLARVRGLPCCVCQAFGLPQLSPTTAHHAIHDRHGTRKAPDRDAIPLCDGHHQGTFDTSKLALHRAPDQWRKAYGSDRDYIASTQAALDTPSGDSVA